MANLTGQHEGEGKAKRGKGKLRREEKAALSGDQDDSTEHLFLEEPELTSQKAPDTKAKSVEGGTTEVQEKGKLSQPKLRKVQEREACICNLK